MVRVEAQNLVYGIERHRRKLQKSKITEGAEMKLTLHREDLRPEYQNINCSQTRFGHFKAEVQSAISVVGKAQFREYDDSNYNAIYLTATPKGVYCRNCEDTIEFSEMKPFRRDDDAVDMLCPGCDKVLVGGE